MGWIQAGQIRVYSISDTIGQFALSIFNIVLGMFNPLMMIVMLLFLVSLLTYFFIAIKRKIANIGDVTND